MERLTLEEVADRADVSTPFVEDLVRLGIVLPNDEASAPFVSGDARRARLVSSCAAAGMSIESIAVAIQRGTLSLVTMDLPQYERWAGHADTTFEEVARTSGLSFEFLRAMRVAFGLAPPLPTDRPRRDEIELLPVIDLAFAQGFTPEAILGLIRVYGDGLRQITSAETELWHEFVEMPAQRAGRSEREVLAVGSDLGGAMMPALDTAFMAMYRHLQTTAWMADMVEHMELGLEEAGVHQHIERPQAMVFVDLTGFTRLTEERGDEEAATMSRRLGDVVQSAGSEHGGQAVKRLGDGVMFHFPDAAQSVPAALDMVEATEPADLPPAHIGIHAGPVVIREGDYFGRTVNWAARISGRAGPGEVLVTQEVVDASDPSPTLFEPVGSTELKGISAAVPLFRARRSLPP